ncbi:hypothetical protein Nmel_008084 [Mimus melanotis]
MVSSSCVFFTTPSSSCFPLCFSFQYLCWVFCLLFVFLNNVNFELVCYVCFICAFSLIS